MKIRFLTENTVYRRGLVGEHGLSLIIEEGDKRFLFDAGQSDVYLRNAKKLKEDLTNLDGIILSHGHYDHCGGIEHFPGKAPTLYVREGAFRDKHHRKGDHYAAIGIDWKKEEYPGNIVETGERFTICDGFTLLGKIESQTDFEPGPEGFFLKKEWIQEDRVTLEENCSGKGSDRVVLEENQSGKERESFFEPDRMEDGQLLVVETEKGLSVFMGCSHMGVINCMKRVEKEFPGKHIHTILAGMHLKGVSKNRLERTIEELKKIDFDYLIPVHCTGITAIAAMKEALGDRCLLAEVGKKFEF